MKPGKEWIRFRENMRRWRDDKGVPVSEVSGQTGIPETMLLQIEREDVPEDLSVDQFLTLCAYYGKKPSDCFW